MLTVLANRRDEIAALCLEYGVRRLEVFGSAATGPFDPARSDIDLLVEYAPGQSLGPWLTRYFELRDALAKLLGRPVDLVMAGAVRDEHFRRELQRSRQLLYAA
jgi:hypothetical protein